MSIEEAIKILKKTYHENDQFWWNDDDKDEFNGDDIDNAITTIINKVKEQQDKLDKSKTEEHYRTINKLAEENTILKCKIDRAIEYINKRFIREGEYYLEKSMHFRNCEYGKDLLKILEEEDK